MKAQNTHILHLRLVPKHKQLGYFLFCTIICLCLYMYSPSLQISKVAGWLHMATVLITAISSVFAELRRTCTRSAVDNYITMSTLTSYKFSGQEPSSAAGIIVMKRKGWCSAPELAWQVSSLFANIGVSYVINNVTVNWDNRTLLIFDRFCPFGWISTCNFDCLTLLGEIQLRIL